MEVCSPFLIQVKKLLFVSSFLFSLLSTYLQKGSSEIFQRLVSQLVDLFFRSLGFWGVVLMNREASLVNLIIWKRYPNLHCVINFISVSPAAATTLYCARSVSNTTVNALPINSRLPLPKRTHGLIQKDSCMEINIMLVAKEKVITPYL